MSHDADRVGHRADPRYDKNMKTREQQLREEIAYTLEQIKIMQGDYRKRPPFRMAEMMDRKSAACLELLDILEA